MIQVFGHFGEWLQGRLGTNGPVALITLVCSKMLVSDQAIGPKCSSAWSADALSRFFAMLDASEPEVNCLYSTVPPGIGAGASTAYLVARAYQSGYAGRPEDLANACVCVEGASDPLMFSEPDSLLWASRLARVLTSMRPPPRAQIVGGQLGAPCRTDPDDIDFPDITDLVTAWREAKYLQDFAIIASACAERFAKYKEHWDPMADLARDLGALGHVRAYTGSARGLVFPPGAAPKYWQDTLKEAGLTGLLEFQTGSDR